MTFPLGGERVKKNPVYLALPLVALTALAFLLLHEGPSPPEEAETVPAATEQIAPSLRGGEGESAVPTDAAPAIEQPPEGPLAEIELALNDVMEAADFGIIAGGVSLSPEEAKKARDLYLRERDMWLAFKGFSGDMRLTLLNGREEIEYDLEITMSEPEMHLGESRTVPVTCDMVIRDKEGRWTWKTNDFGEAVIECSDEEMKEQLEGAPFRAVAVFLWPKIMLSFIDSRNSRSGELITQEKFFEVYQPRQNPEARGATDSYAFINSQAPKRSPAVFFENGHVSAVTQGTLSNCFCRYDGYEQIGGFAFPMSITVTERNAKATFEFANVRLAGEGGK